MKRRKILSNKKGAIEIPVKTVIIIIIAIVLLGLFLFFIKKSLGRGEIKIQEQIVAYAHAPTAAMSSPSDRSEYIVKQIIKFDASPSYDKVRKIKAYYWDFESDGEIDSEEKIAGTSYTEPGRYTVTLRVMNDEGSIGKVTSTITIVSKNLKDSTKYENNPLFLISDDNYDDILRLIPITTWRIKGGVKKYTYSVYYGSSIRSDRVMEIMEENNAGRAIVFTPVEGEELDSIGPDSMANYFNYWINYDSVVLVDPDNDAAKLISALFAAFINSPLIFADNNNIGSYGDKIAGKKAYLIGTFEPAIAGIDDIKEYSKEELYDPTINDFTGLSSTALFVSEEVDLI